MIPSLTHLISDGGVDSVTSEAISDRQLLPRLLEKLVCDGISELENLIKMLECRSWFTKAGEHPDTAVVYGIAEGPVSATCRNRLQKLRADGMHVQDKRNTY